MLDEERGTAETAQYVGVSGTRYLEVYRYRYIHTRVTGLVQPWGHPLTPGTPILGLFLGTKAVLLDTDAALTIIRW